MALHNEANGKMVNLNFCVTGFATSKRILDALDAIIGCSSGVTLGDPSQPKLCAFW